MLGRTEVTFAELHKVTAWQFCFCTLGEALLDSVWHISSALCRPPLKSPELMHSVISSLVFSTGSDKSRQSSVLSQGIATIWTLVKAPGWTLRWRIWLYVSTKEILGQFTCLCRQFLLRNAKDCITSLLLKISVKGKDGDWWRNEKRL